MDKDNIIKFNPVNGYNILLTVKPEYLRTKFPYNKLTPDKIILTQNKINIIAKEIDNDMKGKKLADKKPADSKPADKKPADSKKEPLENEARTKKGGNQYSEIITIYG
jgi:hypothetical protein